MDNILVGFVIILSIGVVALFSYIISWIEEQGKKEAQNHGDN